MLTGTRRSARQRWRLRTHVTALIDSQVVYLTISRGRSSAQRLWRLSGKLGTLSFETNTRGVPVGVNSEGNPTDATSQRFWATLQQPKEASLARI